MNVHTFHSQLIQLQRCSQILTTIAADLTVAQAIEDDPETKGDLRRDSKKLQAIVQTLEEMGSLHRQCYPEPPRPGRWDDSSPWGISRKAAV